MSNMVVFILSAIFMGVGTIAVVISTIGMLKFRFVMNRMHAAAIIDTLGLLSICLGLCIATHSLQYIPKLLLIVAIQWVASPVVSHFVSKLEYETDSNVGKFVQTEDDRVNKEDN